MLNAPYKWLLFDSQKTVDKCENLVQFVQKESFLVEDKHLKYISDLKILPDSNFNLIFRNKNGQLCPEISSNLFEY